MRAALYLALVGALAFPTSAAAQVAPVSTGVFADQASPPPIVTALVDQSTNWWANHWSGKPLPFPCPDGVTAYVVPSLGTAEGTTAAWERGTDCEEWLSQDLVDTILDGTSFEFDADACEAVAHGDGHAHGLQHTSSGLMAEGGPWGAEHHEPRPLAWAPHFCVRWALAWYEAALNGDGRGDWEIAELVDEARHYAGLKAVAVKRWHHAQRQLRVRNRVHK